jgi:hypothetical protein
MITQAIKGWLQKRFAWWPWKQTTPIENQQVAGVVAQEPPTQTASWSTREGSVPQAGINSRLFTRENRSEPTVQARSEAADLDQPPLSPPVSAISTDVAKPAGETGDTPQHAPTTEQRLEFLRYLVQQGIVHEGFEKKKTDM